jgi:diadenosine tetraphosphate (Ap4A) HIT family hydrolase
MICPFCSFNTRTLRRKGQASSFRSGMPRRCFDLTAEESAATLALLRDVKAWMDDAYRPDGYTVGWNCGSVGGQEVMHAHLHVIPRFADEPYAGHGIRFLLKQAARRSNRRLRPKKPRRGVV